LNDAITLKDGIFLVPYAEYNGARSVSDDTVAGLFCELDDDGVIEAVFNESIRTEQDFILLMKSPDNLPVFVVLDGELVAAAWLNSITRNHASVHFIAVKRCRGRSVEMGLRVVDYWFAFPGDNGPLLDVLIGNTPANNRLAVQYIKRLGFIEIGEIPHMADGGAMSISYRAR